VDWNVELYRNLSDKLKKMGEIFKVHVWSLVYSDTHTVGTWPWQKNQWTEKKKKVRDSA
jgi:hypothetical protein